MEELYIYNYEAEGMHGLAFEGYTVELAYSQWTLFGIDEVRKVNQQRFTYDTYN